MEKRTLMETFVNILLVIETASIFFSGVWVVVKYTFTERQIRKGWKLDRPSYLQRHAAGWFLVNQVLLWCIMGGTMFGIRPVAVASDMDMLFLLSIMTLVDANCRTIICNYLDCFR